MALRLVLGAIYTAMAVGQTAAFQRMPDILSAYGLVHGPAAAMLATVLIVGELVYGLWFLTRPRSAARSPVWAYTTVSLTWSALAAQAYARGLAVDNCGCFGSYLTQRLTWFVLLQDALTLAYAAVLLRGTHRARAAPIRRDGPHQQAHNDREAKARTR
ncbi:MauE/DoxX family redox-associated membrane protein [Streptomyces sp. NPDC048385]|uniref:MauE/DoxX family redox-associated membrane protein n=1 Tax=unclassified Streptomyces TaxID=2593676 RepID=UPI00342C07AC